MSASSIRPLTSAKLTGGRSSVSGIQATVFGATGFMGRYVLDKLGKIGCRVIVPHRDELSVRHLKMTGDLGQINPVEMTIRDADAIAAACEGSNVVINLLGKNWETSRWSFTDLHASFPSVLAQICAEQGVERFIHLSALGADLQSTSKFARSKAVGEQYVREAFPSATIVRPATCFGDEDRFLNRMAKLSRLLPFYPLINATGTSEQPVYIDDVAKVVFKAASEAGSEGVTYSLVGPKVYTNKDLLEYCFQITDEENNGVGVPMPVALAMATGAQLLPDPWMTVDDIRFRSVDLVEEAGLPGLAELGIKPTPLEDVAERYLMRLRRKSFFVDGSTVVRPPSV